MCIRDRAETAEANTVTVTDISDLQEISYQYEGNDFAFAKNEDVWYYTKDKEFPVAQSYIDAMATSFGNLTAVRELKETDQLSDYGLENPKYTIHLKDSEGTETDVYKRQTFSSYKREMKEQLAKAEEEQKEKEREVEEKEQSEAANTDRIVLPEQEEAAQNPDGEEQQEEGEATEHAKETPAQTDAGAEQTAAAGTAAYFSEEDTLLWPVDGNVIMNRCV